MRWLKSLVIVLGLLIVLGVLLLGFGFYKKTTDPDWKLFGVDMPPASNIQALPAVQPNARPAQAPINPFGTISLNLPQGCEITEIIPRRRYAYLMIGPTPECNRVALVDLERGIVLGTIKPQP